MIEPKRQSDLNLLTTQAKLSAEAILNLAKKNGLKVAVFESLRTKERQHYLYGQGRNSAQCLIAGVNPKWARPGQIVTWTTQSRHLTGNAIDMVFLDAKGQPTWSGDWKKLIELGTKFCGLKSLAPRELSHFEI